MKEFKLEKRQSEFPNTRELEIDNEKVVEL